MIQQMKQGHRAHRSAPVKAAFSNDGHVLIDVLGLTQCGSVTIVLMISDELPFYYIYIMQSGPGSSNLQARESFQISAAQTMLCTVHVYASAFQRCMQHEA